MNLPRLWRTARHLSAGQIRHRMRCRARRVAMSRFPGTVEARLKRAVDALPPPDPDAPALKEIAAVALRLQRMQFGDDPAGVVDGKFVLQNREFDFGSVDDIDWRGDFSEGDNPLRRMILSYMGYAVPLLSHGRAADLAAVADIVRSLERANGFSVPGAPGDVWNAYSASHRLINLLSALALYRKADGEKDADAETEILDHVRFCASFVARNLERDLRYNHLLKNYVALAVYAAAAGDVPDAFGDLADGIASSIGQCILPDGGHAERSPMYHALSVLDAEMLDAAGFLPPDMLTRMKTALAAMSHPDGDIALFNDSWLGEAPEARSVAGLEAGDGVVRLADTGYVRLAGGGDAVIFDCGPCGPDDNPGHAHADFLSVEASISGERFFVDPGVPTYTAGEARDVSRSAASHNGPHVAGAEPIEFWKSFRVGRRGYASELFDDRFNGIAPLWCAGAQDGYAHLDGDVRRFVGLWPGQAMLIADLWTGMPGREAASHFLVPDSWSRAAGRGPAFRNGDTLVRMSCFAGKVADAGDDMCWPRFEVERKAYRIEVTPSPGDGFRTAALWIAWGDEPAEPSPEALAGLFDTLRAC